MAAYLATSSDPVLRVREHGKMELVSTDLQRRDTICEALQKGAVDLITDFVKGLPQDSKVAFMGGAVKVAAAGTFVYHGCTTVRGQDDDIRCYDLAATVSALYLIVVLHASGKSVTSALSAGGSEFQPTTAERSEHLASLVEQWHRVGLDFDEIIPSPVVVRDDDGVSGQTFTIRAVRVPGVGGPTDHVMHVRSDRTGYIRASPPAIDGSSISKRQNQVGLRINWASTSTVADPSQIDEGALQDVSLLISQDWAGKLEKNDRDTYFGKLRIGTITDIDYEIVLEREGPVDNNEDVHACRIVDQPLP